MPRDGQVYKVGDRVFAEFVAKNEVHERAWRITDHIGHGITPEGTDITRLIQVLQQSEDGEH